MLFVTRCSACGTDVVPESRFCANCGAHLAVSAVVTAPPAPGASSSSAPKEGRFPVGIVLGERYRILGLLGRGGMGEVYRAHDLKLEQQVALKFLPEAAAFNPGLMERFRSEVRIARQISHRSICRVYDLGDVNGAAFISMEYVDGEDLASLLRRIGRLPGDKALEFARRLCAGLAAAHEKGVLHRDLKPANIMIDGRGQLLIMDFGLAAVADAVSGADIRSGTPAYMAPEQRDGRGVTVRSDIYALGVVLAEMFTGQRPSADGTLSTTTKDLDPAVERVIRRCIDPNPTRRFGSGLEVARALPGGDPLAEALAAGETPSPEMVAASEDTGALSVRATVVCFAVVIAGLIAAFWITARWSPLRPTTFPDSPQILAVKARDLAKRFGYGIFSDSEFGLVNRGLVVDYARANVRPELIDDFVRNPRTSPIVFWYRQSPRELATIDRAAPVSLADPPLVVSGMVDILLDSEGRLTSLTAVPPQEIDDVRAPPIDWTPLFEAAGLDIAQWKPVPPRWMPLASFDEQAAWSGSFSHAPSVPIQIDAASWRGRPVQFVVRGPWAVPRRDVQPQRTAFQRNAGMARGVGVPLIIFAAAMLAWRHHRSGRGDSHGALRLTAFVLVCSIVQWALLTHHVATDIPVRILDGVGEALAMAVMVGVLYLALEPYVRRRWPQSLISWTRLLSGGWNDRVVAGHILIGLVIGIGYTLAFAARDIGRGALRVGVGSAILLGPHRALAELAGTLVAPGILFSLGILFVFFVLRVMVRRTSIAAGLVVLFGTVVVVAPDVGWGPMLIFGALQLCTGVAILIHYGVLPMAVAISVSAILSRTPLTTDLSAWYASSMLTIVGMVLATALWSFRAALGGRRLIRADLLDA